MTGELIMLFASTFGLAISQDRPPAKSQELLPEYVQRYKQKRIEQEERIRIAQQAAATNPNSAEAHFKLGDAYRNAEGSNAEHAAKAYKRAILLKLDYFEAYKGLAWAYGFLKEYEKQFNALEHAIALNPNDAEVYCQLGDAHSIFDIKMKDPPFPSNEEVKLGVEAHRRKAELAAEAYKQALRIKPDYAEAHRGLGTAYLSMQRHSEALEAYKKAIAYDPKNPIMHIGLGYVYLDMSDYERALEQHKAALRLIEKVEWPSKGVHEIAAVMLFDEIQERLKEK